MIDCKNQFINYLHNHNNYKIKMELISSNDILGTNQYLKYFGGHAFAKLLMQVLKLNKLNEIYDKYGDVEGIEFIDKLLEVLGVSYEFNEEALENLPEGPFITISNHPFGGLDGILLIKAIAKKRKDFKVLVNFLLNKIEPISDFFIGVNPFEKHKSVISSFAGLKQAKQILENNGVLGLFPAGEVSSFNSGFSVTDRQWQHSVIKLIKNSNVPIVPIYFHGSNSRAFHILGKIHPMLRTIKLPSELLNKKKKVIKFRIGKPITLREQNKYESIPQYTRYLRARTYALKSSIDVDEFFENKLSSNDKIEEIIPPTDTNLIKKDVENVREDTFLFRVKDYSVFCAPSMNIPSIMNEIGRLREITFREVGEGTNKSIDIDEFDLYYNQMFIWDEANEKIVGAYRIGKGHDIMQTHGSTGFYLNTLFKLKTGFNEYLDHSLELGRSFIVKEYQRNPLPLFLLWKGILYFVLKNPQYRYLIGPVSISNNYSQISKRLIVQFIVANYYNKEVSKLVKPRNAFKAKTSNNFTDALLDNVEKDINALDKFIGDFEEVNSRLPVLLKKYMKLNAKIIGFNVDPLFNNCLDGFIFFDIFEAPIDTIESLSKDADDSTILDRFKEMANR